MSEPEENKPASLEEIESIIVELEQYRERLVTDALQMAKKAKLSKKLALEHLQGNPEIIKIDAALAKLRPQVKMMRSPSAT